MSNWKPINQTYLYDGTFDGLLTIVFDCYVQKVIPKQIFEETNYIPNFLDNLQLVQTDREKAQRVFHGIEKNISHHALYHAYYAFLCQDEQKEMAIIKYLYHGFEVGPQIDTMLSIDYVFQVHALRKRALRRMSSIKRFVTFYGIRFWYLLCFHSPRPLNFRTSWSTFCKKAFLSKLYHS